METCALDRPAAELTVVDVYDIAALLGHEFERVIERYGCESMVGVVPKVVRVLELLEVLVNYGGARDKAEELQLELDRLRHERNERYEQDRKHQMELELVEDVWRAEVQDLLSQIAQLQRDNKKLLLSQSVSECPVTVDALQEHEGSEKEREVLEKLKELVEKQRDEIRSKQHELSLRNDDVEALQLQQNRVIKMNQDLRHRLALMEAQGKDLVQHRAELEAVAQARLQELGQLKQEVSRLQRELQDLDTLVEHVPVCAGLTSAGPPPAAAPLTEAPAAGPAPAADPAAAVRPSSVWVECAGDPQFLANCFEQVPLSKADSEESDAALLLLDRSAGTDSGDDTDGSGQESDSPRFTLQELRDVLHEKNQLKAQVFLLQEELAYYKTEECEEDPSLCEEESPEPAAEEPESGIRRLIFTAIMPMVAAGLISDDPTLMPIGRGLHHLTF